MAKLEDFIIIKDLHKGEFCVVQLVVDAATQTKEFAMKTLKKIKRVEENQIEIHELLPKIEIESTFIIQLYWNFKDGNNLCLVFEYVPRGDLFALLRTKKRFTDETAGFCTMQVVLAVEYLHRHDVAHRDIKPKNIVIASNGYLKLADLGFAKIIPKRQRTFSNCGTIDYKAPEILHNERSGVAACGFMKKRSKGYDKSVDWWAVGVLIYEMLLGHTPFRKYENESDEDIEMKIMAKKFKWFGLSDNPKNLIEHFLKRNPEKRFGNCEDGIQDIKSHAWFRVEVPFCWSEICDQTAELPAEIASIICQKLDFPKTFEAQ